MDSNGPKLPERSWMYTSWQYTMQWLASLWALVRSGMCLCTPRSDHSRPRVGPLVKWAIYKLLTEDRIPFPSLAWWLGLNSLSRKSSPFNCIYNFGSGFRAVPGAYKYKSLYISAFTRVMLKSIFVVNVNGNHCSAWTWPYEIFISFVFLRQLVAILRCLWSWCENKLYPEGKGKVGQVEINWEMISFYYCNYFVLSNF